MDSDDGDSNGYLGSLHWQQGSRDMGQARGKGKSYQDRI